MITDLDIGVLPARDQGANISTTETMTLGQRAVMDPYPQVYTQRVFRRT